jgi:hypothetical protein
MKKGLLSLFLITTMSTLSSASPLIRINEVAPLASPDWAELYCVDDGNGGEGVDISGFMLTDLDGEDTPLATSPVTVRSGEYIVVHWGDGEDETDLKGDVNGNGYRDLYLEDTNPTNTDDQLLLVDGERWLDAVCWANQDGTFSIYEKDDVESLVAKGHWRIDGESASESDCVDSSPLTSTRSIGRDRNSTDSNTMGDWSLLSRPTPGGRNPSPLPPDVVIRINEVSFKEEDSKDWIELYCVEDGGGVDIGGCYIKAGATVLKTIVDGTIMRKGDYLVLHNGRSQDDTSSIVDGVIDIFAPNTALTSTDFQVILYDALDRVEDAVCWADRDETWSSTNQERVNELSREGEWRIEGDEARQKDCVDSSNVKRGYSIARDGRSTDTDTKDDWVVDETPSMGRNNEEEDPSVRIEGLKLSDRYILVDGSDPSRKETVISFILSVPGEVSVRIYDIEGRCVRILWDREELLYGENMVVWDGLDDGGRVVPIGIYICYIEVVDHISKTTDREKVPIVAAKDLD